MFLGVTSKKPERYLIGMAPPLPGFEWEMKVERLVSRYPLLSKMFPEPHPGGDERASERLHPWEICHTEVKVSSYFPR